MEKILWNDLKVSNNIAVFLKIKIDDHGSLDIFRQKLYDMYWLTEMSTSQIQKELQYPTSQMTNLFKQLKIPLRNLSNSLILRNKQEGKSSSSPKKKYFKQCEFKFNVNDWPIPNKELILTHGKYHPIHNKNGCSRDHIISKFYGWNNNINCYYISHPANCQILLNSDNIKKSSNNGFSFETLKEKCHIWDLVLNTGIDPVYSAPQTDVLPLN